MINSTDMIIIGGGPVGCSLALALQKSDIQIHLLEKRDFNSLSPITPDSRPLSLSYRSQQIFQKYNIWPDLEALATPIDAVHISQQNQWGRILLQAKSFSLPTLGHVVPFDLLQNALWKKITSFPNLTMEKINQIVSCTTDNHRATVQYIDANHQSKQITAPLVVATDGMNSSVRDLLKFKTSSAPMEHAFTATLHSINPHRNWAFERFTSRTGTLAALPLIDRHLYRLVWVVSAQQAEIIKSWQGSQWVNHFNQFLTAHFSPENEITPLANYVFSPLTTSEQTKPCVILLGNARHTISPLAAQGLNCALRDVYILGLVLNDAKQFHQKLGSEEVLRRYVQARQHEQRWAKQFTHNLQRFFGQSTPGLNRLKGPTLASIDLFSALRRRLALKAMGLDIKHHFEDSL